MIAIDANFRLKRRAISNNARDPALGSGWAYFVEDGPYQQHVLNYADQVDVSHHYDTCYGFKLISLDFNMYGIRGVGTRKHEA